jgi:AraC-like DNA-binding protein
VGTGKAPADRNGQTRGAAQSDLSSTEPIPDRWRVSGFESIELLRGSQITQEYPSHWHDEIYLSATLSGKSYLDYGGCSLETPRGTLALVAPGDIHANQKIDCTFRCLFIEFHALKNSVEQFIERNIPEIGFRSGLIENHRTIRRFLQFHRSLEKSEPGLEREDLALSFLHELAARHATPGIPLSRNGNEDIAVRRTRQFLDEHYAERVSLHELAALMRLSACHLNRSFRRKIGMPPHEYQLQVRILKAKSFLRRGRSISETASLVGFVDQSHFTRHFKRSVGVTPGKFRQ